MPKNRTDIESCSCNVIHDEVVEKVRGIMPEEKPYDLAELFKVL